MRDICGKEHVIEGMSYLGGESRNIVQYVGKPVYATQTITTRILALRFPRVSTAGILGRLCRTTCVALEWI